MDWSATLGEEVGTNFLDMVKDIKNYKTPGTPNLSIIEYTDDSDNISAEDQKLYQLCGGMLLYLVMHSCPNIANSVKQLSKVLDGAYPIAFQEMLRLIKSVLYTKNMD